LLSPFSPSAEKPPLATLPQAVFQRKERKEKEGMERCHAGITQHRTWRNYRISPSGALAS
ncbi:hypothetical protein, partial [Bifidobacterium longum]|uniref:hypothetical protein n=1 Tax=Bifidobacterium longum TaxID=216816 RepID=UPI001A955559